MMLDTNALSAFLEGDEQLLLLLRTNPEPCLPAIVLGEYRFGLLQSRARHRLEPTLDELEKVLKVLVVDSVTARKYADIRHELKQSGRPIPENDIWIAALLRQHHLQLVSKDQHFDAVKGLKRLSW
jgi:tRNA(fMet)-specific endonuclease VapC